LDGAAPPSYEEMDGPLVERSFDDVVDGVAEGLWFV